MESLRHHPAASDYRRGCEDRARHGGQVIKVTEATMAWLQFAKLLKNCNMPPQFVWGLYGRDRVGEFDIIMVRRATPHGLVCPDEGLGRVAARYYPIIVYFYSS